MNGQTLKVPAKGWGEEVEGGTLCLPLRFVASGDQMSGFLLEKHFKWVWKRNLFIDRHLCNRGKQKEPRDGYFMGNRDSRECMGQSGSFGKTQDTGIFSKVQVHQ